jgi:hypothetical protein
MELDETERHAAAVLAAALISASHPKILDAIQGKSGPTPEAAAAMIYHDCLDAIRAERAKRHRAQAGVEKSGGRSQRILVSVGAGRRDSEI